MVENFFTALSKSFILHIILGVVLLTSVDFETPKKKPVQAQAAPDVIEAISIDQSALNNQIKRIQDQKEKARLKEEQRVKNLEDRAAKARNEEKKARDNVKQIKDQQKSEQKKLSDAKKKTADAQAKRKAAQDNADKAEKERIRKQQEAAEEKKRAEKLRKQREAEEKRIADQQRKKEEAAELARQEELMQQQLAAEQAAISKARSGVVTSEVQKYTALIHNAITSKLLIDDSMKGKECRINIKLARSGFVTSVNVLGGDPIVCKSAQNAILKAETLPVSQDDDVYEQLKNINLTVAPEF